MKKCRERENPTSTLKFDDALTRDSTDNSAVMTRYAILLKKNPL